MRRPSNSAAELEKDLKRKRRRERALARVFQSGETMLGATPERDFLSIGRNRSFDKKPNPEVRRILIEKALNFFGVRPKELS